MTRRTIDILDKAGWIGLTVAAIMFAGLVVDGTDANRWLYHVIIGIGFAVAIGCSAPIGSIVSRLREKRD